MKLLSQEVIKQRNEKLMKKAEKKLKDAMNSLEFKNLCKIQNVTFPMKSHGLCMFLVLPNLRTAKVEVINENPRVELYEDFLSDKELDMFTREVSKYPYIVGTTADDSGISSDCDFKVQKDIYYKENKIVDEFLAIMDYVTGLGTDEEDYIEVILR